MRCHSVICMIRLWVWFSELSILQLQIMRFILGQSQKLLSLWNCHWPGNLKPWAHNFILSFPVNWKQQINHNYSFFSLKCFMDSIDFYTYLITIFNWWSFNYHLDQCCLTYYWEQIKFKPLNLIISGNNFHITHN